METSYELQKHSESIQLGILALMIAAHANSRDKGFWPEESKYRNEAEMIALMHSELSELLECIRAPTPDVHCPSFPGKAIEVADLLIRAADYAFVFAPQLPEALIAKMEFNRTRPHKHGKEF